MQITHEMIRAASESRAKDDEGEYPPLFDLLGFSGENKTRTVIRSALAAALAAMPRTIETAPKDGTRILGHDRNGWHEMWWKEDMYEGAFWQDDADSEPNPTYWLPCPPKPTN